ncbi:TonB-dependent receptor [bacterium]|nr:MAG: TonB-dependent receptor [bacterium]
MVQLFILLLGIWTSDSFSNGKLSGSVHDSETKEALIGVNVLVVETSQGAVSDIDGDFSIPKIEAGIYTVKLSYVGYKDILVSDVIIKPNRITQLPVELLSSPIEGEGVTVTAGYFANTDKQAISSVSFNNEEIRRSPGAGGEISRVLQSLAGVASTGESSQDIFVRGGSANEINFYIDNIAIPSIKHFEMLNGTSNGPIGLVNTELVREIEFSTGGFGAQYGYVLSGVGDIKYREANKERFLGNIDMSMAGFGGTFEIPDVDHKGSWLISGRRSYLDIIADAINAGGAPRYSDIQGKYHRKLGKSDEIIILGVAGASHFGNDEEDATELGTLQIVDVNHSQATIGANWQHIWGSLGYSNTSISFTRSDDNTSDFNLDTQDKSFDFDIVQDELTLRQVSFLKFNKEWNVTFGAETKWQQGDFSYDFTATRNTEGVIDPAVSINQEISGVQSAGFISVGYAPFTNLSLNLGGRINHNSFNNQLSVEPRFAAKYDLTTKWNVHAALGWYHQRLPMYFLSQSEANRKLDETQARHIIIGSDYMLTESTKLTVEFFDKYYTSVPVLPADSLYASPQFVPDAFDFLESLEARGTASSRGVDIMIQKKLAENFYGGINLSFYRARYTDHLGVERNRIMDVQSLFSVIGGYRPNKNWEFSARWSYLGSRPYTPANETQSLAYNSLILDNSKYNEERLPAFHSLYVRFDRRFFFNKITFVTFMEIWNAYNRTNDLGIYFNKTDQKIDDLPGFTFLPIGGFKLEF